MVVQEQAHGLPHYAKEKPEHHIAHLHKHLCNLSEIYMSLIWCQGLSSTFPNKRATATLNSVTNSSSFWLNSLCSVTGTNCKS